MGDSDKAAADRPPAGDPGPADSPADAAPRTEGDERPPAPSSAPDEPPPRARAKEQLLARWRAFPAPAMEALDRLLDEALARAGAAEPEILTVMNPVSRPMRLRLAPIAADADLDRMYHRASAELSVNADGRCYLVYRQLDGGDYAVLWSAATSLPEALLSRLPGPARDRPPRVRPRRCRLGDLDPGFEPGSEPGFDGGLDLQLVPRAPTRGKRTAARGHRRGTIGRSRGRSRFR